MTTVDDLISYASTELGKPYVYGDEGPSTFDCSGLMQWVYAHVGIRLPRTAAQQQAAVTSVASPQPGDLVFWGNPAHHVALYIGGGKIIAAPHTGALVQIEDVNGPGTPSTYGRVAGLGAGLAPVIGTVTGIASNIGTTVSDWLGGARTIAIEGLAVVLGLVLLGAGAYALTRPKGTP